MLARRLNRQYEVSSTEARDLRDTRCHRGGVSFAD